MREVDYTKLKKGENYLVEHLGFMRRGKTGTISKGIGIDFHGITSKDIINSTEYMDTEAYVVNGDPLVKFKRTIPLNTRRRTPKEEEIFSLSHFKPYNAGKKRGFGFKFYEINNDTIYKRLRSRAMQEVLTKPRDNDNRMDSLAAKKISNDLLGYNTSEEEESSDERGAASGNTKKGKSRSKSKPRSKSKSRSKSNTPSKKKTRSGGKKSSYRVKKKTRKKYIH